MHSHEAIHDKRRPPPPTTLFTLHTLDHQKAWSGKSEWQPTCPCPATERMAWSGQEQSGFSTRPGFKLCPSQNHNCCPPPPTLKVRSTYRGLVWGQALAPRPEPQGVGATRSKHLLLRQLKDPTTNLTKGYGSSRWGGPDTLHSVWLVPTGSVCVTYSGRHCWHWWQCKTWHAIKT